MNRRSPVVSYDGRALFFLAIFLMSKLRNIWIWLRRIRHTRGFGVQSPSAYHFIRYVVNEHWPYYQYDLLGKKDKALTRKLGKLYFRVANWFQPHVIVNIGVDAPKYADYFHHGCNRAKVLTIRDVRTEELLQSCVSSETFKEANIWRFSLSDEIHHFLKQILDKSNDKSLFIIEGIYRNKSNKQYWKEILSDSHTGVAFDLYYCGIVFFDKNQYKRCYKVNF